MEEQYDLSLTNNIVITFSGRANSGKDTAQRLCRQYIQSAYKNKVLLLAFADYLKCIIARNDDTYDEANKNEKRSAPQTFGAKVRSRDEGFWLNIVYQTIDVLRRDYDVFIISDCRYENEKQPYPYRLSYPIFNIFVDRKVEGLPFMNHESEKMAQNAKKEDFHYWIENDGSIEDLMAKLIPVIDDIFLKADKVLCEARGINLESLQEDD